MMDRAREQPWIWAGLCQFVRMQRLSLVVLNGPSTMLLSAKTTRARPWRQWRKTWDCSAEIADLVGQRIAANTSVGACRSVRRRKGRTPRRQPEPAHYNYATSRLLEEERL